MSSALAAFFAFLAGLLVALLAVFGGVKAVTGGTNPASASDTVVSYDVK